jgi:hypothetical protein
MKIKTDDKIKRIRNQNLSLEHKFLRGEYNRKLLILLWVCPFYREKSLISYRCAPHLLSLPTCKNIIFETIISG